VMLTLAAVMGGYLLASKLHVSGPLAMVVAGLVVGNHGREFAMSHTTRQYVDMFWEMIDDILNAVLFVLIGMEVLVIAFSFNLILAALVMVVMTLIARGVAACQNSARLFQFAAWRRRRANLGWPAWWYLGSVGAVIAARPRARCSAHAYLRHCGVLDSDAGPHHRSCCPPCGAC